MQYRQLRRFRFGREDFDREAVEELELHRELLIEELIDNGLEPEAARREATRRLGDVERFARECERLDRRHRLAEGCRELGRDLLHGWRRMRRQPVSSLVAAGTLALGLGAAVTLFSLVNGLFLKPLPGVEDQGRLIKLLRSNSEQVLAGFTYEEFEGLSVGQEALSGLAAFRSEVVGVGRVLDAGPGGDTASGATSVSPATGELLVMLEVSAEYFPVLGTRAARGRFFVPDDTAGSGAPVVVLSHATWQGKFGGDRGLVGRRILVRGEPRTVIGIAEPGFAGTFVGFNVDLWLPLPAGMGSDASADGLELVGRLAPGVSRTQAAEVFTALGRNLGERLRPGEDFGVRVVPETGFDESLQGALAAFAATLMAVAVLVLGVACFNVANLLLARSAERQREMSVRAALGAGRRRLVRQLLTESLLLAVAAATGGWLLALAGARALATFSPRIGALAIRLDLTPDLRVLGFAVAVAAVTSLGAALVPALRASHPKRLGTLRGGARGGRSSRTVPVLVVAQLAVTVVLLATTALFVRALQQAASQELGFDPDHVLAFALRTPDGEPADAETRRLHRRLEDDLAALPGVEAVSRVVGLPLSPGILAGRTTAPVEIPGVPPPPGEDAWRIETCLAAPGYFEVMGIPRLQGGDLAELEPGVAGMVDTVGTAVVNRTFVERFFGDTAFSDEGTAKVLGRQLVYRGRPVTVVGVVEDSKVGTVHEAPRPFLYASLDQRPVRGVSFVLRTAGDPAAAIPAVRRVLQRSAPDQLVLHLSPMRQVIRLTLLPQRMAAAVSGAFGALGLLLAAVGVSGMLAYTVSRRRREIGVRLALGADRGDVLRLVLGGGLRLAALGLGLGLLAALGLSRFLSFLLAGLSPADPVAYGAVVALLALTALPALWLPARRALAVEPRTVLEEG